MLYQRDYLGLLVKYGGSSPRRSSCGRGRGGRRPRAALRGSTVAPRSAQSAGADAVEIVTDPAPCDVRANSPLDDAAPHSGCARLQPFGGWDMPLQYPGVLEEHLRAGRDAVVFDVSHLGHGRVPGTARYDALQWLLTNDLDRIEPGRAQYTHLLDPATPTSSTTSSCGGSSPTVPVMPNASNTDRLSARRGGDGARAGRCRRRRPRRTRCSRCRARRPRALLANVDAEAAASRGSGARALGGVDRRRHRLHRRGRRRDRTCRAERRRVWRARPRRGDHAGRARRARHACGSRPASRCTATSSGPASRRSRPASVGSCAGTRATFRGHGAAGGRARAGSGPSPPRASRSRAAASRGRRTRCCSTARESATVTQRQLLADARAHDHARVPRPDVEPGAAVQLDVRPCSTGR